MSCTFLDTDPEARLDSRHYQKKKVVCLERGPLSLVSGSYLIEK
jgi:hypothetical protein